VHLRALQELIVRCETLPSHFGCSSALGYVHMDPRAHACSPVGRSYAAPARTQLSRRDHGGHPCKCGWSSPSRTPSAIPAARLQLHACPTSAATAGGAADVQAMRGDGWWWSWDAWKWPRTGKHLMGGRVRKPP
jgi:hypothetical protein